MYIYCNICKLIVIIDTISLFVKDGKYVMTCTCMIFVDIYVLQDIMYFCKNQEK